MSTRRRRWTTVGLVALGVFGVAGCGDSPDIGVTSTSEVAVTVRLGDEDVGEVPKDGGVVLLEVTDCYRPIVLEYADGRTVELDKEICPGQELAVDATAARVIDTAGSD